MENEIPQNSQISTSEPIFPPLQESITPPNRIKILFLAMAGLLLLLAVGVGGYYVGTRSSKTTTQPQNVVADATPTMMSSTLPSQEPLTWKKYVNTISHYTISYPETWKITGDDYSQPALTTTETVYIFDPADKPGETFFSGIRIEYIGMLFKDLTQLEKTTMNGLEMYRQVSLEGESYYVNIPDTGSYLYFTGVGGHTDNESRNEILKQIFATFAFSNDGTTFNSPQFPGEFKVSSKIYTRGQTVHDGSFQVFISHNPIVVPDMWDSPFVPVDARVIHEAVAEDTYEKQVELIKSSYVPETLSVRNTTAGIRNGVIISGTIADGYGGGEKIAQAIFKTASGYVSFHYYPFVDKNFSYDEFIEIVNSLILK